MISKTIGCNGVHNIFRHTQRESLVKWSRFVPKRPSCTWVVPHHHQEVGGQAGAHRARAIATHGIARGIARGIHNTSSTPSWNGFLLGLGMLRPNNDSHVLMLTGCTVESLLGRWQISLMCHTCLPRINGTAPGWEVWQFSTHHTVDAKNPAPVDRWFIPLFIGCQPSWNGGAGFLNHPQ